MRDADGRTWGAKRIFKNVQLKLSVWSCPPRYMIPGHACTYTYTETRIRTYNRHVNTHAYTHLHTYL